MQGIFGCAELTGRWSCWATPLLWYLSSCSPVCWRISTTINSLQMLIRRRRKLFKSSQNNVSTNLLHIHTTQTHLCVYAGYINRVIVHPAFLNVSYKEAERVLAKMDQGEAVFRPSSKVGCRHTLHTCLHIACAHPHTHTHTHTHTHPHTPTQVVR